MSDSPSTVNRSRLKLATLLAVLAVAAAVAITATRKPAASGPAPAAGPAAARAADRPARATPARRGGDEWLAELEALAGRDPQRARAALPPVSEPDARSEALTAIAAGWARKDPQAAAAWILEMTSEEDASDAVTGLVPAWAATAPDACLAWADTLPEGNLREDALLELADAWSANDPQTAFDRFLAMDDEDGLDIIVSAWAVDAPEDAISRAAAVPDDDRRDSLLQSALAGIADVDPQLAWREAGRMKDPEFVETVRSMALETLAVTNPREAIDLARSAGSTEAMLAGIARGWAESDPAATREWISTIADEDLAERLREELPDTQ